MSNYFQYDDLQLKEFLAERDALFRNPTAANVRKYRASNMIFPGSSPIEVAMAAVHKARLQWLDATDEMIIESTAWLRARGYETTFKGAPALTPTMRDAQRAALGKPPLNS
jgi:hypothetical protein